jgi:hypothetical protein
MATFNRLDILKSLKSYFKDIFTTIYYTDRPSSTTTQQDTFLVIKNGSMEDMHAYGDTYVSLQIFQKDINGLENTSAIDKLQKSVVDKLPINNDIFYTEHPQVLDCKSDGSGFHYLTIYFGITIK